MILIYRIEDNEIMNDRQSGGWKDERQLNEKKELLASIIEAEKKDKIDRKAQKERESETIADLKQKYDAWILRRKKAVCKSYGGVPADYGVIQVKPEDTGRAMTARYISINNGSPVYDTRPLFAINGNSVTVSAGWVVGNHRLVEDDITDFSELNPEETQFFKLVFAQNKATLEISLQLFLRGEAENFAGMPNNLAELYEICHGSVSTDNTITIGGQNA
jgi:hypothetical protein